MNERSIIAGIFAAVAFVTALLPAGVVASLAGDASFLVLPVLAAVFGGLWSAILSRGIDHSSEFSYLRGLAVVALSFICIVAVFATMRPMPYQQSFVALLIVGWGFMVFPGFVGGLVAVWFLRYFGHEPNPTADPDARESGARGSP